MDFLTDQHEDRGHIVIIITHDMPIVARYAKRIVLMSQGRKLADGPTHEIFAQPDVLAQTFVEPPQITQLAQAGASLGFDPGTLNVEGMLRQFEDLRS